MTDNPLESGLPGAGETGTGGVDAAFSEPLGFGGAEVEHDPSTSGASELEPTEVGLSDEEFVTAVLAAPQTRPDRYTVLEHLALDEQQTAASVAAFVAEVASARRSA